MKYHKILQSLTTKDLGKNLIILESIDSTNEELKRITATTKKEYTVIALTQTAGRGRGNNRWYSPPDENIYMSFSVNTGKSEDMEIVPASAALAIGVHRGIEQWTKGELSIKWPNDIYLNRKKIAGILCEILKLNQSHNFLIAGIGINVNSSIFPDELSKKATSLFIEEKQKFPLSDVVASILNQIEPVLNTFFQKGFEALMDEYKKRCLLWNKLVKIDETTGIMKDITNRGFLLLQQPDGKIIEIFHGTVEFLDETFPYPP